MSGSNFRGISRIFQTVGRIKVLENYKILPSQESIEFCLDSESVKFAPLKTET